MHRLKTVAVRTGIALASAAVLLALLLSFEGTRSTLARFALSALLATHGMHVAAGTLHAGTDRLIASDLEIDDEHGRVFSVHRLDVAYDWRALFGKSDRRYGIRSVDADLPMLRIFVLPDGSTNLSSFVQHGAPSAGASAPVVPFACTARLRGGRIDVENPFSYALPGRAFAVTDIEARASADGGRIAGTVTARYDTSASKANLRGALSENDNVGFAQATLLATGVDIAPMLDAFISTEAFEIQSGIADATLAAYDAGYTPASGPAWRIAGRGYLREGRLRFDPLAVPVRDLAGPLMLQAGYLGMPAMRGSVAGLPLAGSGSIRIFDGVRFALQAQAHGDLRAARTLFSFGRDLAVSGPIAAQIRVDGPLDDVHVGGAIEARGAVHYDRAPFNGMRAAFYYHDSHVTLPAVAAEYDGGRVAAHGDVDLTAETPALEFIATADLPASLVPFAANLNRGGRVQARMFVTGPVSTAQYGAFAQTRGGLGARTTIDVAGRFTEAAVGAARAAWPGGDVTVRSGYDHTDPANRALFASIVAAHAPVELVAASARLPGITGAIALPAISGILDGVALVRGTSDGSLQTAADFRAHRARAAGADIGDVQLRARGLGPLVQIDRVSFAGQDVQASARGAARIDPMSFAYAISLTGTAAADLSRMRQAPAAVSGRLAGDFEAAINSGGWAATLTSRGGNASLAGHVVKNAILTAAAGAGQPLRFGARADIFGGSAATLGTFALGRDAHDTSPAASVWASGIDAVSAGRVAGLPLDAGTAVVIGQVVPSASGSALSGAVSLEHGRIANMPIGGDADVTYRGESLHADARLDIAGTRARVAGDARGVAPGSALSAATIDANAFVLDGDAGAVLAPFLPAAVPVAGSFDASVSARGAALSPDIAGSVRSGAGTIRGVTFTDTAGTFSYRDKILTLRRGQTQLGTTRVAFGGAYGPQVLRLRARSQAMDLSDVNNFFGGYDALDGTGAGSLAVSFVPGTTRARGDVAIADAEVAGVPLGSVTAAFSGAGRAVHADVTQSGELGRSRLGIDVALGGHIGDLPDPRRFTYDVNGQLSDLDLGLVTRLAGLEDLGMQGRVDANGRAHTSVIGTTADVAFAVHEGSIRKLNFQTARGTVHADGTKLRINDVVLETPVGHAAGSLAFGRGGSLDGSAQIALTDLGNLAKFAGMPGHFAGAAGGTVTIAGNVLNPQYTASLSAGRGSALGIAYDDLSLHATYSRNALSIGDTKMHLADGNGTLSLAGTLPLQLSPLALGPANKPVHLSLEAAHLRMRALDPLVTGLGTVDGTVEANVAASGVAGKPELSGAATLRDGTFASRYQSVPLRNISAALALSHDGVTLTNLTGAVGSGSFGGSGAATVVPAVGLRTNAGLSYYAKLHAHAVPLAVPDWVSGTLDGDVSMTQSGFTPYLSGAASLRDGTIPFSAIYALATTLGQTAGPVPTQNIPGVPALQAGHTIAYGGGIYPPGQHLLTQADLATPPPTIFDLPSLNLGLTTKVDNLRVRGGPVDITTAGTLAVNGSVRDPQLDGVFNSRRGQITAFGLTFRVSRGQLVFDPDGGVLPSLDATAVTNVQGDQIALAVSGRIDHLNTELSSSQGKSSEQILSTLVTGSDIGVLTGGVTQQTLVSGATRYLSSQLTSSLLNPFTNALAQTLNVEDVSLRFDTNGELVVDVRKYVTPTVALLYTSTVNAPVTQGYGVSYNVRDFAALEFGSTISPSGFTSFLLNMRFTFK